MTQQLPQCDNLQEQVNSLLQLLQEEPALRQQDTTTVEASLKKAVSPRFEIVFAGAFSAGKSMLINALLERELLYSAEGHATGTECYLSYAEPDSERVVLTFLSEAEIGAQANTLSGSLGLPSPVNLNQAEVRNKLHQESEKIIQQEGGESKSELAKQANALKLLIEGFEANRDRIHTLQNATYAMEAFNFSNLQEAASYARRGSNSAVLKKLAYYCHHPLLQDGNVIIDTPGIDAPIAKDRQLTYDKIADSDTSAVICVLKPASAGDMTASETELLETMRTNPGIRDRVFYVFNRVDETWYNTQLRDRLNHLINSQFNSTNRIYKTSALLGFYGSQIKHTTASDRFGLDSLFAQSIKGLDGQEETPQFVYEFNRYCFISEKLPTNKFPIFIDSRENPTQNAKYVRLLKDFGNDLINQLIKDSGITNFSEAITRYLTEEKRPQLFENLADDLQPLCISLKQYYLSFQRNLDSQPQEIEAMKQQELAKLSQQLKQVGDQFQAHIAKEISDILNGDNSGFETDFQELKLAMVSCLDSLLTQFSVATAHRRAVEAHPRNSVVPLLSILAEAFYYLANELEDVLLAASETLVSKFFERLQTQVRQQEYYREIYRLLGNDSGIERNLKQLEIQVDRALANEARTECDRYVRERPQFYSQNSVSMWQLHQTLQESCRSFDYQSMVEAEPAIRQLLKLDFDPKVSQTVNRIFRQTINQTLKTHLLPAAEQQAEAILQQYSEARTYLEQTLEKEAEAKIANNQRSQDNIKTKIAAYNQAVAGINSCLEAMKLDREKLPPIREADLNFVPVNPEFYPVEFGEIVDENEDLTEE
ncbi:MAG: dynamin family protein [Oscillatoria sp. PMC 1051.18]|nr:dynamin family protein [Oscillatoria sp. PMC 1050.18]MEC5032416.1 dynamin family protein [Oscillatoria sp. PMC 1051.18]